MSGYWSALARAAGPLDEGGAPLSAHPRQPQPFEDTAEAGPEGFVEIEPDLPLPPVASPKASRPPEASAQPADPPAEPDLSLAPRATPLAAAPTEDRHQPATDPERAEPQVPETFVPASPPPRQPQANPPSSAQLAVAEARPIGPSIQPVAVPPVQREPSPRPDRIEPVAGPPPAEPVRAEPVAPEPAQVAQAIPAVIVSALAEQVAAAVAPVEAPAPPPIVITIDQLDIRLGDAALPAPAPRRDRPVPVVPLEQFLRRPGELR